MKRINLNLDCFDTDDLIKNKSNKINISLKNNQLEEEQTNFEEEKQTNFETQLINNLLPKNNNQRILALSIVSQLIFNSLKND